MQDLVTLERSPSPVKGSESLARIHAPLDRPMILLQVVIQIRTSPTAAAATQIPLLLQLCNHLRVRGVTVNIYYARPATPSNLECELEKALRGSRIAFRRKPEVDRRACGIHGAIEVAPLARHPDVGFVHPQEPLAGFSSRRHLRLSSGAYRCTHRQMVVWSTDRPRSVTSSST